MIIDECVLMDSKIDKTHKVELTVLNVTPLRLQLHWAKFWMLFNKTAILKLKNLRTGSRAPLIITLITKLFFFLFCVFTHLKLWNSLDLRNRLSEIKLGEYID